MSQNDRRVDGIIECLAHELIVERLVGHVHRQKIHAVTLNFFDPRTRVLNHPFDFFDRQVADRIRLTGQEPGNARRFFLDRLKQNFFDLRLGAPIIVIAREH